MSNKCERRLIIYCRLFLICLQIIRLTFLIASSGRRRIQSHVLHILLLENSELKEQIGTDPAIQSKHPYGSILASQLLDRSAAIHRARIVTGSVRMSAQDRFISLRHPKYTVLSSSCAIMDVFFPFSYVSSKCSPFQILIRPIVLLKRKRLHGEPSPFSLRWRALHFWHVYICGKCIPVGYCSTRRGGKRKKTLLARCMRKKRKRAGRRTGARRRPIHMREHKLGVYS